MMGKRMRIYAQIPTLATTSVLAVVVWIESGLFLRTHATGFLVTMVVMTGFISFSIFQKSQDNRGNNSVPPRN